MPYSIRLSGTHLERQKGNWNAWTREQRLKQTDVVRDRIALLKDKIKAIDKQMGTQRGNRGAMVQ
jgi:GTP-binding protein HflX